MYDKVNPEDLGKLNAGIVYPLGRVPAAIAEIIDAGAKNMLDGADETTTDTRLVSFNITLPAGTYVLYIGEYSSTDTDDDRCQAYFLDGDGNTCSTRFIQTKAETMYQVVTVTKTAATLNIYASDNYSHSAGDTVACAKVMVCTKAAWDVSQTYQPYRPSYQELYERVVALEEAE